MKEDQDKRDMEFILGTSTSVLEERIFNLKELFGSKFDHLIERIVKVEKRELKRKDRSFSIITLIFGGIIGIFMTIIATLIIDKFF